MRGPAGLPCPPILVYTRGARGRALPLGTRVRRALFLCLTA